MSATMAGEEHIVPCIGPLSTSLEGIKLFLSTIIAAKPWLRDPSLMPFEWRDTSQLWGPSSSGKKLKVAVLWDDGVVHPHPPITHALKAVVEKLKDSGNVEVVDWKPYKHDLSWEIIAGLYFADNAAQERAAIEASGEPYRPLTDFIITNNKHRKDHTITSIWEATVARDNYRTEYAAHWLSTASDANSPDTAVDVILCPAGSQTAPKLDTARYWGYTAQWNLLDFPAVVFPVDKVGFKPTLDLDAEGEPITRDFGEYERFQHKPRNAKDKENWDLWQKYGPMGYMDSPVSLQIVGRRYEDERVLRALEVVKQEVGKLPFL
jgi:amidase